MRSSTEKPGTEMANAKVVEAVDHEKRPASEVVSVGDSAMTRKILLKLDFRYHSLFPHQCIASADQALTVSH